jgi:hypothetical protein
MDLFFGFLLGLGVAIVGLAAALWVARSGLLFDDEGERR